MGSDLFSRIASAYRTRILEVARNRAETVRGKLHDGGIRAKYTYEECELANKKECPGRCTVTGTMFFVRGL
jgi:hypothetical protein